MKRRFRHGKIGVSVGFRVNHQGVVSVAPPPVFVYSLDFTDDRNLIYFPTIF